MLISRGWKRRSLRSRDRELGLIMLVPALVLALGFTLYPLVSLLWLSLHRAHFLSKTMTFDGLANFGKILKRELFWPSVWRTVVWTAGGLCFQTILGVFSAYILNLRFRHRTLVRALLIFPYLVPTVVAATVFRFIFNDLIGVGNYALMRLGFLSKPVNLFGDPTWAMAGVIAVGTWKYYPMIMIAVLARLQTIPVQLYEAAEIDGATRWGCFWHITVPFIMPVLIVTLLIRSIWLFNHWDLIYLLTGGGPLDRTTTLPILLYNEAFGSYDLGSAAAIGTLGLLILFAASRLYLAAYTRAEERL